MKKVLDVGQCDLDNSLISDLLKRHFDVSVDRVKTRQDAAEAVNADAYDLVLVNRLLDIDGTEGSAVLGDIKSSSETSSTPVMIVSNFEQTQVDAVAAGAEPGFGKAALNDSATVELLSKYLR